MENQGSRLDFGASRGGHKEPERKELTGKRESWEENGNKG